MHPKANDRKILVVGWDAADWRVIEPMIAEDKMPNLAKFMKEGVHGNISTLSPALSPMLWTSIATGKRPYKHGIHGFSEPIPDGTVCGRSPTSHGRPRRSGTSSISAASDLSLWVGGLRIQRSRSTASW